MITSADPDVRAEFTLTLRARTALHLGAAAGELTADLALARDGFGRCYLPGSSWGGVLRRLAERQFGADRTAAAFGPSAGTDPGYASRVVVDDTPIDGAPIDDTLAQPTTGGGVRVELRTGVGIDRVTGAAADRIRYDREVLPPGTTVTLRLRYEGPQDDQDDPVGLLRGLVAAVRCDGIRIGAGTRRGLGLLSCTSAEERLIDLRSRAALLDEIGGATPATSVPPATASPQLLRILLSWRTVRPVVVGGSAPGHTADLVPLLTGSGDGHGLVPVLPGSSVKGVLRSTAERILRTLAEGAPVPAPGPDFVAGLDGAAAEFPALEALFGSRERAGAVMVPDTHADAEPVPAEQWADYLAGTGGRPAWAAGPAERTHVAIDRWTGGAAAEQLFTVQETTGVRWPPLVIEIDLPTLSGGRIGESEQRAAVVLLGLAVTALIEGSVGLGGRTTRGLGEIEFTGLDVTAPPEFPDWSATPGTNLVERWWGWLTQVAPDGDWLSALSRNDRNNRNNRNDPNGANDSNGSNERT